MKSTKTGSYRALLTCAGLLIFCGPVISATESEQAILDRLTALEENQHRLEAELKTKDARIQELERRIETQQEFGYANAPSPDPTPATQAEPDSQPLVAAMNALNWVPPNRASVKSMNSA